MLRDATQEQRNYVRSLQEVMWKSIEQIDTSTTRDIAARARQQINTLAADEERQIGEIFTGNAGIVNQAAEDAVQVMQAALGTPGVGM